MAHEDFWKHIQKGKDGQNSLASIRWDKMEKELKEKHGKDDGGKLFKQMVIKFFGMTKVDHLSSAMLAAAEGDDPMQQGFARALEVVIEAYKTESLKTSELTGSIDDSSKDASIENLEKMFALLEGITSSNRINGYFDLSEVQGNNRFRRSSNQSSSQQPPPPKMIIDGTEENFKNAKRNRR